MKFRYLSLVLFLLIFVPVSFASVSELQINPEFPQQGDLIQLSVYAEPFETVDVNIELERELDVISGNYILRVNDIEIPQTPNRLSVKVYDVATMNVAALGMTLSPTVSNEEGSLSVPNFPPGIRDIKISGYAADGVSSVTCEITAWTQVSMDENGEYHYSYDLGDISPGEVNAVVGGMTKTVTIYPVDNTSPVISENQPDGEISVENPSISASYSDSFGIKTSSIELILDGNDVTSLSTVTTSGITYLASSLGNNTNHQVQLSVSDENDNTATKIWDFVVKLAPLPDTTAPTITNTNPNDIIQTSTTTVFASLNDNKKIDPTTISISYNGQDVSSNAQITENSVVLNLQNLENNTLHTVLVTVEDKAGNDAIKEWSFTVQLPPINSGGSNPIVNRPPKPKISVTSLAFIGDSIRFDATGSSDSDGIILSYIWDLGNGATKTGPTFTYQYNTPGEMTITLTVTDNRGASISTKTIITLLSIDDYTPIIKMGTSRTVFTGQKVYFDGSASTSEGGPITHFAWDFGDQTIAIGSKTSHVYNSQNNYTVTLFVTDQRGVTGTSTLNLNVQSPPLVPTSVQDLILQNGTQKVTSTLGLSVTATSSRSAGVYLLEYPDNPYPTKPLPTNSTGNIKDISISDPDAITWPILVEVPIPQVSNPTQMGLYWYNGTSWVQCENTGYNETTRAVWAYMTRKETSGSPIIPAYLPTESNILVTKMEATPDKITIGDSIHIIVNLENQGDLTGVFETPLTIGSIQIPLSVSIGGHESTIFTYSYQPESTGSVIVNIEEYTSTINVEDFPADLNITSIKILDDIISTDERFQVNVSISNHGDTDAHAFIVQIILDETVIGQDQIANLAQDQDSILTFLVSVSEPGDYQLYAHVDSTDVVLESNELNNLVTHSFTVERKPEILTSVLLFIVLFAFLGFSFLQYRRKLI